MAKLCEGRVVIVTGAGRGVGREHALMLARHGAKVVVNDTGGARDGAGRDPSLAQAVVETIRQAGGEAVANADDVSDWGAAKALVEQAVATFGKLDVVVNNAGILRNNLLLDMDEDDWDEVVRTHMKGAFTTSRHAAAYWRDRFEATGQPVNARIINTSSTSGVYGNMTQASYSAAKAGIASFTIVIARELARYGITANAVCPHAETRMTPPEHTARRTAEENARRHPRFVAPVVVWLASEQSAGVTARVFDAGGGKLIVLEGWTPGPEVDQAHDDPVVLGAAMPDLAARARRNSDMLGRPLD